jgi:hypothetical protein
VKNSPFPTKRFASIKRDHGFCDNLVGGSPVSATGNRGVGSQDGVDFLVMEHLEGETLAQRMRKGLLPLDLAVKVGCEIADVLDKAHRAGIVHRDLKPGNVMLTKAGAKLLDFGLAKPLHPLAVASGSAPLVSAALTMSSPSPQLSPLTSHGTIVGTMQYMSPEQIEGREADGRSDIFALGAVFYEMVTGKRAFEGKSQLTVASAILEKDPEPISTLRANVTPALAHVIDGCLNKDPEQRWQSDGDISRELKWISNAAPEAAIASTPRPAKQVLVYGGVAALLLIATIVLAVKLLTRTPAEQWKLQSDSDKHDVVDAEYAAIQLSADGSKLAFVAADAHSAIFVRDLRTGKLDQLKGTEGAAFPFWSPDGRALGFFAAEKLRTVSLDQGMVQTLCDALAGRGGTWNTDGQIVFTPNISDPLYVVSDSGGTPKAVTPATTGGRSDRVPFFLPDQKHFLYIEQFTATSNELHASYDILVGSVDGAMPRKVVSGEYDSPQFAEGKLLYGRGRSLYAQDFSLSSFQVSGKPVKIADDCQYLPWQGFGELQCTPGLRRSRWNHCAGVACALWNRAQPDRCRCLGSSSRGRSRESGCHREENPASDGKSPWRPAWSGRRACPQRHQRAQGPRWSPARTQWCHHCSKFLRVRWEHRRGPVEDPRWRPTCSAYQRRRTPRSGCRRTRTGRLRFRFPTWAARLPSSAAGSKAFACRLRSWLRRRFAGRQGRAPASRRCFRSAGRWLSPEGGCRRGPRPEVCAGIVSRRARTRSWKWQALRQPSRAANAGVQARRWKTGL